MDIFWTVLIIQGIIFGGFCAFIASEKNRNSAGWFFLGFFFSILAVLALIAIPKENSVDHPDAIRKCPFCAEFIKAEAVICRFCQKDLPALGPYSLIEKSAIAEENDEEEGEDRFRLMKKYNISYARYKGKWCYNYSGKGYSKFAEALSIARAKEGQ